MQSKKELAIVIVIGVVLLIVIVAIVLIAFNAVAPQPQRSSPTPSPTRGEITSNPPVIYEDAGQAKLLERVENRQTLSETDQQAKTKMLSLLPSGQTSGTIQRTNTIAIDYLAAPNVFQVEILTINIDQAKKEAVDWFSSQGFSQTAICTYPVQFYLNYDIAEQLRPQNITFSPLAPGC